METLRLKRRKVIQVGRDGKLVTDNAEQKPQLSLNKDKYQKFDRHSKSDRHQKSDRFQKSDQRLNKRPYVKKPFDDAKGIEGYSQRFKRYINSNDVKEAMKVLSLAGDRFDFTKPRLLSKNLSAELRQFFRETLKLPLSRATIHKAVAIYTKNPLYVKRYKVGAPRFNLSGKRDGVVTEEDLAQFQNEIDVFNAKLKVYTLVKQDKFDKAKEVFETVLKGDYKKFPRSMIEKYQTWKKEQAATTNNTAADNAAAVDDKQLVMDLM